MSIFSSNERGGVINFGDPRDREASQQCERPMAVWACHFTDLLQLSHESYALCYTLAGDQREPRPTSRKGAHVRQRAVAWSFFVFTSASTQFAKKTRIIQLGSPSSVLATL